VLGRWLKLLLFARIPVVQKMNVGGGVVEARADTREGSRNFKREDKVGHSRDRTGDPLDEHHGRGHGHSPDQVIEGDLKVTRSQAWN